MSIVGGMDIHRKQITFDYVDPGTGEVRRGQICPADREHLAKWLARFAGQDAQFALEGCTGWRYVAEEIIAAGLTPHLADPAEAAHLRGPKRRAKTDRADARHQRVLLEPGRVPECWVPPSHVLECRALMETYLDLRDQRTGWVQRIHAVLFRHGAPHIAGKRLGTAEGAAALRPRRRGARRRGSCRWPSRRRCCRCMTSGCTRSAATAGPGPAHQGRSRAGRPAVRRRAGDRAGAGLLAGRGGPVLLLPPGRPVRRAGHHRLLLRRQALARAAVPAGTPGAALVPVRGRQGPRPRRRPDHAYYSQVKERSDGKRAALSEARKIVRQAVPHPGRARRRRPHRRLTPARHRPVTAAQPGARPRHPMGIPRPAPAMCLPAAAAARAARTAWKE